jgi:hypothetical protein
VQLLVEAKDFDVDAQVRAFLVFGKHKDITRMDAEEEVYRTV